MTEPNSTETVSEGLSDAVEQLEDATVETIRAAVEAGDIEAAERAAAAVLESMRRAVADVSDAGDAVEAVAEEVAEDAPTEDAAEAAEDAVEAAQDASDAVEEVEETLRDEIREAGGGEATEAAAVDHAIHEEAEELTESVPVENAPAIAAEESFTQEVADVEQAAPERQELIAPEPSHPWFKKRKIFGRSI